MKLTGVIAPALVAAAAAGYCGPYDESVGDGLEQLPQAIAPQSIAVSSRYFDTVLPSGLGGPEDYFCRTMAQRQAINDAILAANPRPTGIYVMLDHEHCNPYDSGVLIGTGTQARFPDVNTPTELVNKTKMTEWYNDINELDVAGSPFTCSSPTTRSTAMNPVTRDSAWSPRAAIRPRGRRCMGGCSPRSRGCGVG